MTQKRGKNDDIARENCGCSNLILHEGKCRSGPLASDRSIDGSLMLRDKKAENMGAGGHSMVGIYEYCIPVTSLTSLL